MVQSTLSHSVLIGLFGIAKFSMELYADVKVHIPDVPGVGGHLEGPGNL